MEKEKIQVMEKSLKLIASFAVLNLKGEVQDQFDSLEKAERYAKKYAKIAGTQLIYCFVAVKAFSRK